MRVKGTTYNTKPNATVRYCVGDYLAEMNKAYTEKYRVKFEELTAKREHENKLWSDELSRGWRDVEQRNRAEEKHRNTLRQISEEIADLQAEAKTDFEELITEADERFERHARPTGDKVDLATVELLKSGILSDKELIRLADDFKGNVSMQRIIGKYAEERAEHANISEDKNALKSLAFSCKNNNFNYREPLESYAAMAVGALKDDTKKNRWEVHAISAHKTLISRYEKVLESVKDLYISENYEG